MNTLSDPHTDTATTAAPTHDAGCICHGNWRDIIAESESLFERRFVNSAGVPYLFLGVLHGADDYYYLMSPIGNPAGIKHSLLSCVGSIEGYGFVLQDDAPAP